MVPPGGPTILSITTFSITKLSIKGVYLTLRVSITMFCRCAECGVLFIIMLNVIMLNVVVCHGAPEP